MYKQSAAVFQPAKGDASLEFIRIPLWKSDEWKTVAEIFTEIFFSYRREYGTIEPKGCGYNENRTAPPAPIICEGTKLVCLH